MRKKKILIGMSGGVDSSVAAATLKKQGYGVTGVFLLTRKNAETKQNDTEDVKAVCEKLDIPLKIFDARKRFRDLVVKYFLDEYKKGRTPNPCVFCNENFKFKLLFEIADKIGANFVATGHYALTRKLKVKSEKSKVKEEFIYKLFQAKDDDKDQSYFLYRLKQDQLSRMVFPLGDYEKTEVRKMAKEFRLPVSEKKESQDVCFLRGSSPEKFLKEKIKMKKGGTIDTEGNILGEHRGLPLYTTGQRKGIEIGGTGPYFVVARDFKKNILVVSNKRAEVALYSKKAKIENVSWVAAEPELPSRALAMTRYRNPLVYATIRHETRSMKHETQQECFEVRFEKAERAVTAGQSAVFYTEEGEVIGGGIIK